MTRDAVEMDLAEREPAVLICEVSTEKIARALAEFLPS